MTTNLRLLPNIRTQLQNCTRMALLVGTLMTAVSTAQERLPGEIPLKWDRGDILNRPLPTIQEVVRSIQSPDVQPLVGFRFYGATRNHYAPSWSRDGKSLCCLRSDLNLHTCKLLLFTHLDQPQPTEVYSEVFTFEHMHAWSNTLHTTLLFSSNNEESREENLHFLDLNRERGTLNIRRMTTGKDAKVLPSFTQHGSELEVVYRQQAKLMQTTLPTATEPVVAPRSLGEGQEATWSRDGRLLALIRDHEDSHGLFARDPQTQREIQLFAEPDRLIRNASWSPDGRLIACFSRPRNQLAWEMWVCPVMHNSQPRKVVAAVRVDEDFRQIGPSWSADGRRIWYLPAEGEQGYYPMAWVLRDGSQTGKVDYHRGLTTALDLASGPLPERPVLAFVAVQKLAVDVFVLILNHP